MPDTTKKPEEMVVRLLLILIDWFGSVQNDDVINHPLVPNVRVINTHPRPRLNRGYDRVAPLVHNMTTAVERIARRLGRIVLTNDQRFGRLITGRRAVFSRGDDCSRYCDRLCSRCCSLVVRTGFPERERRNK